MATNKIPNNWNALNTWFNNFQKAFNANAKNYGFTANEIKMVNQFCKNWQTCYTNNTNFSNFTKFWNQFQNSEFAFFQGFISNVMGQISKSKNFNGNWQMWFGNTAKNVTVKKTTAKKSRKTTKKAVKVSSTTKPVSTKTTSTTSKKSTKPARKSPRVKSTTTIAKAKSAKKPIAKKTTVKKSVAKKSTAKPVAKKAAIKKTVAKSATGSKTMKRSSASKRVTAKSVKSSPIVSKNGTAKKVARKPLNIKKTRSTKVSKGSSSTVSNAPFVWFTNGKSGVNVYVGSSKNGNFNLPKGTKAAFVEFKNGNGRWKKLTQGSNFPFVHSSTSNGKMFYRACWINNTGKKGTWSKPISYTMNPAKAAA